MKVHIWNEQFQLIGSLTTITDKNWNVCVDIKKERERAKEEARSKYEELKDLDYEELFQKDEDFRKKLDDD